MKTIKAFIKRHPVLSYFALTFAISWGGFSSRSAGPGGSRPPRSSSRRCPLGAYWRCSQAPA